MHYLVAFCLPLWGTEIKHSSGDAELFFVLSSPQIHALHCTYPRYASKEMSFVWSPAKKFRTWRLLWVALATAEKELGEIRDTTAVCGGRCCSCCC